MSFKDRTYCASPNCNNECGRKMSDADKQELDVLNENLQRRTTEVFAQTNSAPIMLHCVSYGYFCGEPE